MQIERQDMSRSLMVLGLLGLFIVGFWWPVSGDIGRLRREVTAMERELGVDRTRTDGLKQLAQEVDALRTQLDQANRVIPEQGELAQLLRDLSVQIEEHRLSDQGIATLATKKNKDYTTLPVQLTFSGPSLDVFRFIHRVESMPRFVQVRDLSIGTASNTSGKVEVKVGLDTYSLAGEGQ